MPSWSNRNYVIATYQVDAEDLSAAANAIARGQSVSKLAWAYAAVL